MALNPKRVVSIDEAQSAIDCVNLKIAGRENIVFEKNDVYHLEDIREHFDIAVVRGLLHHLYDLDAAISGITKCANEIIIVELNGYNLCLKALEKLSRYHREHEERSYTLRFIKNRFECFGAIYWKAFFSGLVPFFVPIGSQKCLKNWSPLLKKLLSSET